MNANKTRIRSVPICVHLWLAVLLWLAFPALAAQRKPKYQKYAPEIHVQILERRLAEETLPASERARLSVTLAGNYYQLKEFEREAEVLEDTLAAGIADPKLAAQAHYYLGRTYQALGSNEQAAEQFEILWTQFPGSQYHLHSAMELGDLALQAGDSETATQWYQAIIDLQPKARLAFLARDKLRALAAGLSAEEITGESNRPVPIKDRLRKLDEYLYSQLYDKADAIAQELIGSRTNAALRAAMHYHLAHHYWMYGHLEGADRFLSEAVKTGGDRRVQALILAGHIKRGLYQTDAALDYYRQAIQAAPAKDMTITAYQQATRLLLRDGREAEGLALASAGKQAFSGKPELPAYLDRIANTLRDRAHPLWRDYAAQVAVTATNEFGRRALMQLGNEARLRRDWTRAEKVYRDLADRPSTSWRSTVDMQVRLLEAQLARTNTLAAARTETKLLGSLPKLSTDGARAYVLYRLAKLWLGNANPTKAETLWQQILTQFPATDMAGMAQVQLARLYEARRDLTNAVAMYEAFVQRPASLAPFKLHAYVHLFRLKQALGDPVSAGVNLQTAKQLALQSNDAELQLNLAQYLLRRGDKAVARQLLDAGIENAEAAIRGEKDPQKRLWWEYLIARRLDAFSDYERLAQRLGKVRPDLQNAALEEGMRYSFYYLLIRALEYTGRNAEAESLCAEVIGSMPEGSDRLSHMLYRMAQEARRRGDTVAVRELAVAAFREQPADSLFSQLMYLQSAVEDFNAGRYADALAKTTELEKAIPASRNRAWAAQFRWDCHYVKGRCLKALGSTTEGQRLIAEAMTQKGYMLGAYNLREPSSPAP